jgi:hypothetical protein
VIRLRFVDELLRRSLGRGEPLERIRVHQVRGVEDSPRERVADCLGLLLERRLVLTRLVGPDEAERTDGFAGGVAQDELHLVALAAVRRLEVRLAGVDHPHVVLVAQLADAPDVRGDDHVVRALGRRQMHHDHEQVRVLRHGQIHQLLGVDLDRDLRV